MNILSSLSISRLRFRNLVIITSFAFLAFALFQRPWEISGESTGYWTFANELASHGKFINLDRSPFYVLYLQIFRTLAYPNSVRIESVATTIIGSLGLYLFLSPRIGFIKSILFIFFWAPFLQIMEPTSQSLGLAFVCIAAVQIRIAEDKNQLFLKNIAYSLFMLSALCRVSLICFLVAFALREIALFKTSILPRMSFFKYLSYAFFGPATLATFVFIIVVLLNQSTHPWNNAWMATDHFLPKGSLSIVSIIGHFNWHYIQEKYGSFANHDIYFTHMEAYNNASNIFEMFSANPNLFIQSLFKNYRALILDIFPFNFRFLSPAFGPFGLMLLIYGSWSNAKSSIEKCFILSCLSVIFLSAASYPKVRYMVPLIPVIAYSADFYSSIFAYKMYQLFGRINVQSLSHFANIGATIITFGIFSLFPIPLWLPFPRQYNDFSLSSSFVALRTHSASCKSMIVYEHNFFRAFVALSDQTVVNDIWGIPPYGYFNNSTKSGLGLSKADCIFVSLPLVNSTGMGTNNKIRYQRYILPFLEASMMLGDLQEIDIPRYGKLFRIKS
jgi:hypothetical protein